MQLSFWSAFFGGLSLLIFGGVFWLMFIAAKSLLTGSGPKLQQIALIALVFIIMPSFIGAYPVILIRSTNTAFEEAMPEISRFIQNAKTVLESGPDGFRGGGGGTTIEGGETVIHPTAPPPQVLVSPTPDPNAGGGIAPTATVPAPPPTMTPGPVQLNPPSPTAPPTIDPAQFNPLTDPPPTPIPGGS